MTIATASVIEQIERPYSESISIVIGDGEKFFTVIAVLIGGAWVYYNFFRERIYYPKLELTISNAVTKKGDLSLLVVTISLKNVGLSKVKINQEVTVCTVYSLQRQSNVTEPLFVNNWAHSGIFRIFTDHQWIEHGEVIVEQQLIVLPERELSAYKLTARVVGQRKEWNAMAVVICDANDKPVNNIICHSHEEVQMKQDETQKAQRKEDEQRSKEIERLLKEEERKRQEKDPKT